MDSKRMMATVIFDKTREEVKTPTKVNATKIPKI